MPSNNIKFQKLNIATLFLETTDSVEIENIIKEKVKSGGVLFTQYPIAIDLSMCSTAELEKFNFEKISAIAQSHEVLIIGVTSEKIKERIDILNKTKTRFIMTSGSEDNEKSLATSSKESQEVKDVVKTSTSENTQEKTTDVKEDDKNQEHITNESSDLDTDLAANIDPKATYIHYGNVRSGTQIYAENKSLIIFGNVGDGAEIVADDCIFVFGKAMGRIIAGAKNSDSVVYCTNFDPQLISINGTYFTADDIEPKLIGSKVLVSLENDKLKFNNNL